MSDSENNIRLNYFIFVIKRSVSLRKRPRKIGHFKIDHFEKWSLRKLVALEMCHFRKWAISESIVSKMGHLETFRSDLFPIWPGWEVTYSPKWIIFEVTLTLFPKFNFFKAFENHVLSKKNELKNAFQKKFLTIYSYFQIWPPRVKVMTILRRESRWLWV